MPKTSRMYLVEGEYVSLMLKTFNIFWSCLFPALITTKGNMAGFLMQKFTTVMINLKHENLTNLVKHSKNIRNHII